MTLTYRDTELVFSSSCVVRDSKNAGQGCLLGVKNGRTQSEHILVRCPPDSDQKIGLRRWSVRGQKLPWWVGSSQRREFLAERMEQQGKKAQTIKLRYFRAGFSTVNK